MKLIYLIAVVAMPSTVLAQGVSVSECVFSEFAAASNMAAVECEIANAYGFPVQAITYSGKVTQSGRTVPWMVFENITQTIAGGIEPGETITEFLTLGRKPSRMDVQSVTATITVIIAEEYTP